MNKIFFALLFSILFSSCGSTFFYSKISSSDNDIFQNEDGDYIVDDDSVLVAYWFNGRNTPLFINVYNKSESPLYVDWNSSFLMKSDSTLKLFKENILAEDGEFSHLIERVNMVNGEEVTSTQNLGALPNNISYIPPQSRATFSSDVLSDFMYSDMVGNFFSNSQLKKEAMKHRQGHMTNVTSIDFTNQTSPLSFKTYLVLYNDPTSPFFVENEFYISTMFKAKNFSPSDLPEKMGARGDITYMEKESAGKKIGQGMLYTSLGILAVVAVITADPNTNYEDDEYYDY